MSPKGRCTVAAIIAAAGTGSRMGLGYNKVFMDIMGCPLICYSVRVMNSVESIEEIVIVTGQEDISACHELFRDAPDFAKVTAIVSGGASRHQSVANGLAALSASCEFVLVHDGARPCIRLDDVTRVISAAWEHGAAILGTPVTDTVKVANAEGFVERTLDRSCLWAVQTPQCFRHRLLADAIAEAASCNFEGTDESSLVEHLGVRVKLVASRHANTKVTRPADLYIAERILREDHSA